MATAVLDVRKKTKNVQHELNTFVERSADLLLFKEFEECHKTCLSGITRAKLFMEDQSVYDSLESLCVVCIQALAEMNKWHDVLPLIQDVYTSIELCPTTVIQLCILLHARVKEYPQCHALASIWLRCEDNSHKHGYDRVAALYIEHVMLPQGQLILAMQFLNSCTFLSENVKDKIIKYIEKVKLKDCDFDKKGSIDNTETPEETIYTSSGNTDSTKHEDPYIVKYVKYIGCVLASKLSFPTLDTLWKIAAVLVSFCLIIRLALHGDLATYLPQVTEAWSAMLKALQTLFSPYRPGR